MLTGVVARAGDGDDVIRLSDRVRRRRLSAEPAVSVGAATRVAATARAGCHLRVEEGGLLSGLRLVAVHLAVLNVVGGRQSRLQQGRGQERSVAVLCRAREPGMADHLMNVESLTGIDLQQALYKVLRVLRNEVPLLPFESHRVFCDFAHYLRWIDIPSFGLKRKPTYKSIMFNVTK